MAGTVRERLERLAKNSVHVRDLLREEPVPPPEEHKLITPGKVMLQRIERAIKIIEDYNAKMLKDSECYLSLFYDRKKAEQEFLGLLKEAEEKGISIPLPFRTRIEAIKSKIRDKPIQ